MKILISIKKLAGQLDIKNINRKTVINVMSLFFGLIGTLLIIFSTGTGVSSIRSVREEALRKAIVQDHPYWIRWGVFCITLGFTLEIFCQVCKRVKRIHILVAIMISLIFLGIVFQGWTYLG